MKRQLLAFTVLLTLISGGGGCGFQDQEPAIAGGEFRFVTQAALKTIDPQGTSWMADFRMIRCLFEPLLRLNHETHELEPGAAAALPTVSDDGLTYTFTLREDAAWSNGDAVTASDFVYGWKRAMFPDFAADYSGLFFCIAGAEDFFTWRADQLAAVAAGTLDAEQAWAEAHERFAATVGIQAVDDRTLRVTLAQPTAYFNDLASFPTFSPIHEKSAASAIQLNADTGMATVDTGYFRDPGKLVTNGAYLLQRWDPGQQMILDQNPHYWDRASMTNTRLVMHVIEDTSAVMIKYRNGELDWYPHIDTNSPYGAGLLESNPPDLHVTQSAGTYFYRFNCRPTIDGRPNPLADPRVRRAFSLAVDRQEIVDAVTRIGQPVARTFVPPGAIPGYDAPTEAGVSFDPETARQLLADAGYPGGRGLSGLTILFNSNGGHEHPAQAIRDMWKQHLGVDVGLESMERVPFSHRTRTGGFTICRSSWYGDYRDPTTFLDMFRELDGNNDSRYHNPQYDALLKNAAETQDPAARMALLRQAETVLLEDQPLLPLYHYVTLDLFDPEKVKGLEPNAWNNLRLDRVRVLREEKTKMTKSE